MVRGFGCFLSPWAVWETGMFFWNLANSRAPSLIFLFLFLGVLVHFGDFVAFYFEIMHLWFPPFLWVLGKWLNFPKSFMERGSCCVFGINMKSLALLYCVGLGRKAAASLVEECPMVCLTPRWSRQCCQDDADCEHGPRQLHGYDSRRTDFGSSDWSVPTDPSGYPQSGTTCQHLPGPEVPK